MALSHEQLQRELRGTRSGVAVAEAVFNSGITPKPELYTHVLGGLRRALFSSERREVLGEALQRRAFADTLLARAELSGAYASNLLLQHMCTAARGGAWSEEEVVLVRSIEQGSGIAYNDEYWGEVAERMLEDSMFPIRFAIRDTATNDSRRASGPYIAMRVLRRLGKWDAHTARLCDIGGSIGLVSKKLLHNDYGEERPYRQKEADEGLYDGTSSPLVEAALVIDRTDSPRSTVPRTEAHWARVNSTPLHSLSEEALVDIDAQITDKQNITYYEGNVQDVNAAKEARNFRPNVFMALTTMYQMSQPVRDSIPDFMKSHGEGHSILIVSDLARVQDGELVFLSDRWYGGDKYPYVTAVCLDGRYHLVCEWSDSRCRSLHFPPGSLGHQALQEAGSI